MNESVTTPPEALLFITSQCGYCPSVLQSLAELVKQGRIGRLEVVNVEARADLAAHYNVRSVPWIRVGEFELQGMHSGAELERWLDRSGTPEGLMDYYSEQLAQGRLVAVIDTIRRNPAHLRALLSLAGRPDVDLTVRIGVSAVMEDFAGSKSVQQHLPEVIALSRHDDPTVRADACYFLALTGSPAAIPVLETLSEDAESTVREMAEDGLQELRENLQA